VRRLGRGGRCVLLQGVHAVQRRLHVPFGSGTVTRLDRMSGC